MKQSYQQNDTIAALATPLGEGGIAVIRISGKNAINITDRVFSGSVKSYKTHTAHFGIIKDNFGNRLDEGLVLPMLAPRSYTGEDVVEIQCHGGMIGARKVLESVVQAGARLAGPGEFTYRAFCNGKIDLSQAEAVQQLICAKSEQAFEMAGNHLQGKLSKKITSFQTRLTDIAAIIEAWVDFPEEGLEFTTEEKLAADLKQIYTEIESLLHTFHEGRKISEGISLTIVGPPNAGKSSLLNALLEKDRAIVSSIAGTTRDIIEEDFIWKGLRFRLIDTAGIRETNEIIEQEGIRRSKEAMKHSDVVLLVLDASLPDKNQFLEGFSKEKIIVVWNKMDLPHSTMGHLPEMPNVSISALEKTGFENLFQVIEKLISEKKIASKEEVLLTSLRHKESVEEALSYLQRVVSGFEEKISPEFLTFDLRASLYALGKIIGKDISEEILNSIFSKFCIGK